MNSDRELGSHCSRRGLVVGLVAVVCASVSCQQDPNPGPLQPPPEHRTAENSSEFRAVVGKPFMFGLLFTKNYGDRPAVLDGVELVDPSGGIAVVGTRAADITGDYHTWSSAERFPSSRPTGQQPLEGFDIAPEAAQAVQLLLGVSLAAEGKHGFPGVAVLYHVGRTAFRLCGPIRRSGMLAFSLPGSSACRLQSGRPVQVSK